jgi:hypothetical protein
MKSQLNWNLYSTDYTAPKSAQKDSLRTKLISWWERTLAGFSFSAEPHVWQTQDSTGKELWSAFDPMTKRSIDRVSADELRAWLEERHYQGGWAA